MGLRESKKAATRLALATAVLRHAAVGGLESVSIDTVAAEVGVSSRTFHNYFAAKEDALIYFVGVVLGRMADFIEGRPSDESLWDAVEYALIEIACDTDAVPDQFITLIRLLETEPTLVARKDHSDLVEVQKKRFTDVITARGDTTALGLYERLVFSSALCTLRVALEMWAEGLAPHDDLRRFLGEAFLMTKSGFAGSPPRADQS
ncbi:TetR/AcrR family transcriptional regulator [Williamsia sp.]|uniref:TetR/AcrR family transcriptional regulator n=1 Tax=Williamsia sp. TaxID=1872085 RepID=UPI002F91F20C